MIMQLTKVEAFETHAATCYTLPKRIEWVRKFKERQSAAKELQDDILLISPPYWDTYSPFSAVPCLVAALKKAGFRARQVDMGIHCIHHVIKKHWKKAADRCMTPSFYEDRIREYVGNVYQTYEDYLNALWFFRGEEYDFARVKREYFGLNAVQKLVVDIFYNYIYNSDKSGIDFNRCTDIEAAVNTWNAVELVETLEETGAVLFQDIPAVVGISITSTIQFIPGCVLAELFRACRPDVTVIMGGSCADLFFKSAYPRKTDIAKYFDYVIQGEGETSVTQLMRFLRQGGDRSTIPNLAFLDENQELHFGEQIVENVSELPAPDYDGLDLSLYLAPEVILPYQTSRGCHYGQCAFCNHDEKYRHNYRSKRMDIVVEELVYLSKRYHVQNFQFVDEAIRPDCFATMVEEMDRHPEFENIQWFFYSRVSRRYNKELLLKARKNGCRMVMFGVESLNQRLLNFIKKGISAETSRYCLNLFHGCGIKTYAWLMSNLPSETLEEAREDLEAVKGLRDVIDTFSVSPFGLYPNTDMYANPERYNITRINLEDPTRFDSHHDGEVINKDAMLEFHKSEYRRYRTREYGISNRYALFFG